MKNINEFMQELINENVNLKETISHIEDGMEYFEENYEGKLENYKLSVLIDKAYNSEDLQFVLTSLLYCSNKDSITDEIFNKLLKFRKGLRRTFFVTLAHCDISFYQLMRINKMKICFEAFGWLMNHMYTSNVFSVEDIKQLLKDSEYIKAVWNDTFEQLLSLQAEQSTSKKDFILSLLAKSPVDVK